MCDSPCRDKQKFVDIYQKISINCNNFCTELYCFIVFVIYCLCWGDQDPFPVSSLIIIFCSPLGLFTICCLVMYLMKNSFSPHKHNNFTAWCISK